MQKSGGVFIFLSGVVILMGILTAEIFYPPGYSISADMISTLGASPPPHSIIKEPSGIIFDSTMVGAGLLIIIGAYKIRERFNKQAVLLSLSGLGALGVGVFPAFHPIAHPISALVAFSLGGVSALAFSKKLAAPFSLISTLLGVLVLVSLALGIFLPKLVVPVLGAGGVERWVAYPLIIWLISLGVYLMAVPAKKK